MSSIIIDVREKLEYKLGHAKNAINIPLSQISAAASKLEDVPKNAHIIVYCRSGARSQSAMSSLKAQGYTNVVNGINKENVKKLYA